MIKKIIKRLGLQKIHPYLKYIIMDSLASSHFCPNWLRRKVYNMCGHNIQGTIYPECFLGYGPKGHLRLGKGSFCNYRCFFDLGDDIVIGENCSIAFGVTFCNSSHRQGISRKRAGDVITQKILIEDGCWIGANVTIMPGVTIQKGCIIGAGSLVTRDCLKDGLYIGSPAHRMKDLL